MVYGIIAVLHWARIIIQGKKLLAPCDYYPDTRLHVDTFGRGRTPGKKSDDKTPPANGKYSHAMVITDYSTRMSYQSTHVCRKVSTPRLIFRGIPELKRGQFFLMEYNFPILFTTLAFAKRCTRDMLQIIRRACLPFHLEILCIPTFVPTLQGIGACLLNLFRELPHQDMVIFILWLL